MFYNSCLIFSNEFVQIYMACQSHLIFGMSWCSLFWILAHLSKKGQEWQEEGWQEGQLWVVLDLRHKSRRCWVSLAFVSTNTPVYIPRHPKSSKYLVSRCLEPLNANIKRCERGFKHQYSQGIFGCLGYMAPKFPMWNFRYMSTFVSAWPLCENSHRAACIRWNPDISAGVRKW